ncbi:MAG TPA: PAS domain-containing sensor histidine kinase [Bacteroidetes bacterium]|nr:PAS domain-containing sensor histidine kinase [Bacteroidota bacterium]
MFQHYLILAEDLLDKPVVTPEATAALSGVLPFFKSLEELPSDVLQLLLTIVSAFIILVTLTFIFLRKRRKMNIELKLKTQEAEHANRNLEKLNKELLEQKERIARELANSEMLYSIMLDSADDGIIFYNTDWSVKFANPAIYSIVGFDHKKERLFDIINDRELLHPDNSDFHTERSKAINQKGFFETEIKVRHKNGKYVVLSTKMVEVKDESGSALGVLSISRDITSLKDTQNELRIAKEKAEESNRLKSTFLANISHEIRTPLNSIVGFANLLNDSNASADMREEYVEYLNQNTEKLLQVITDIIDLSKLENNEIDICYNPVRINSILSYVEEYTSKLIERSGKDISFTIEKVFPDDRDIVYSDDLWLKRVFRHLLDNAVKFTRAGEIELKSALVGSSIMFTIRDTGIGISKKNLKLIFEQFRQEEDGHHRSFEGLGVGLTMASKVVENMDGYLWVESEKGKGSEFFFTIPYRPVDLNAFREAEKQSDELLTNKDWSGKAILVADDNIDTLRYLNRVLAGTGINIIHARSKPEITDILQDKDTIDLVLLNMQMTELGGLEVFTVIREIDPAVPLVARNASVGKKEKDDILKAGCTACLVKPVSNEQLLSVISGFLDSD